MENQEQNPSQLLPERRPQSPKLAVVVIALLVIFIAIGILFFSRKDSAMDQPNILNVVSTEILPEKRDEITAVLELPPLFPKLIWNKGQATTTRIFITFKNPLKFVDKDVPVKDSFISERSHEIAFEQDTFSEFWKYFDQELTKRGWLPYNVSLPNFTIAGIVADGVLGSSQSYVKIEGNNFYTIVLGYQTKVTLFDGPGSVKCPCTTEYRAIVSEPVALDSIDTLRDDVEQF